MTEIQNSKQIKLCKKKFISIHKPPASIRFAPIKHARAVTVEPFKFSPAEPVAYELSYCNIVAFGRSQAD
jgi:hypothetical protein